MQRRKRRPGRPPGSTSDATRAAILRAARDCFARKGFGVATNRDIAGLAGVTPAAIYQYFDSKVALYAAAANEAISEVAEHMRAHAERGGSAVAALSGMATSLRAVHARDESLAPFLSSVAGELQRHPELARHFRPDRSEVLAIVKRVVERGVVLGEIDRGDARRVIWMFLACMTGLAQFATLIGPEHADEVASAFTELLEGRLFSRGEPRLARERAIRPSAAEVGGRPHAAKAKRAP